MSAARAAGGGRMPGLDGVRAVAVALVFVAHAGWERVVPGGLGVTIFFVLSGFLITTLMRQEIARSGTLSLPRFYLRRFLRLAPTLLLVVLVSALLCAAGLLQGGFSLGGLAAALLYGGNYFVISMDFRGLPAGLGVIWSLAVEEHFYLLFPLCVPVLFRLGRQRQGLILASACLAILLWRCLLVSRGAPEAWLGMATDCRLDAILWGCLLAVAWNPWLERPAAAESTGAGMRLQVAGAVAVLLFSLLLRGPVFRDTLRYTLQSAAVAVLLRNAVLFSASPLFAWLNWRALRYLGAVSYTIYLVHQIVLNGLSWQLPDWSNPLRMAVAAVITLAICEPVRRLIDVPSERLRHRLEVGALTWA